MTKTERAVQEHRSLCIWTWVDMKKGGASLQLPSNTNHNN